MSAPLLNQILDVDLNPSEEVMTAIIKSRIKMIMDAPFFGGLVMRLQLLVVKEDDPFFQTAATDGKFLVINPKFFMSIKPEERVFVIGHELGHGMFDHAGEHGRRLDRDPMNWNIAADHAVNLMMVESNIGAPVISNGMKLYCDKKYTGQSVEQIYNQLPPPPKNSGGSGSGSGSGKGGTGTQPGQGGQVLDQHLDTGSIHETTDADGNATYRIGTASEAKKASVQHEMKGAIIAASQSAEARQAGSTPMGARRMIDQWADPTVDWRELLATNVSDLFQDDYTYTRLSKKTWSTNVIMPGFRPGEFVHVAAALDMSGSIGQKEATMFLTEVWGIFQMYDAFEFHLWCYDTDTYSYKKFTTENLDELMDYEIAGGGGTSYTVNYDFMKKMELVPQQFINFTDGEPYGSWGDPDYTDTIFVLTNKDKKPPFGKYAYFD